MTAPDRTKCRGCLYLKAKLRTGRKDRFKCELSGNSCYPDRVACQYRKDRPK